MSFYSWTWFENYSFLRKMSSYINTCIWLQLGEVRKWVNWILYTCLPSIEASKDKVTKMRKPGAKGWKVGISWNSVIGKQVIHQILCAEPEAGVILLDRRLKPLLSSQFRCVTLLEFTYLCHSQCGDSTLIKLKCRWFWWKMTGQMDSLWIATLVGRFHYFPLVQIVSWSLEV